MVQHISPILLIEGQIGRGIVQNGRLVQIVFDHLRHEIVNALVIGNAVAGAVQQGDVALAVDVEDMRNADQGFRVEGHGIHVLIGNPAVHGTDALFPPGVARKVECIALHLKVIACDKGHAHLLGEIRVLKIGRVMAPRREHDTHAARVHIVHDMAKKLRIIPVVLNRRVMEGARAAAALQPSDDGGIRGTGGNAEIVLQNIPDPILPLYQVDAGHMGKNLLRRHDPLAGGEIAARGVDKIRGYNAI